MIGPRFTVSKAGQAGLCFIALAAAFGGLFVQQRNFLPGGGVEIVNSGGALEKKAIALGKAGHRQALLYSPPHPTEKQEYPVDTLSRGERPAAAVLRGLASWYGGADGLHGALTASGEPFDQGALTAAHRFLPFGTRVRVTFIKTGKSVVVRINDRGPFVAGRIIDLSRAAAAEIGMELYGVGRVELSIVP